MSPKAKNYQNLHQLDWTPNWVFRKYSSAKRKEFVVSTGFPAEEKYAAKAYAEGLKRFNEWLGQFVESGRQLLVKDLARAVLASKTERKGGKSGPTYRSVKNQIESHILPHFGHLRPDQITPMRWDQYDQAERQRGKRTTTKHTRQVLIEILKRAHEEGLIRRVPKFRQYDQPPAPPRYIPDQDVLRLIRFARRQPEGRRGKRGWNRPGSTTKLLILILWKQGARPGEVLQYEWNMIHWDEGEHGVIHIPGRITKTGRARVVPLNPRVARILCWLEPRARSRFIFPSPGDPSRPQSSYKTGWLAACRRAGLQYQIYNLRDTFITNALKRGVSSTLIAKAVDNSTAMIDAKYAVADYDSLKGVTE